MAAQILVINTGNTSSKIALFSGQTLSWSETIRHSDEELKAFPDINAQKEFRNSLIHRLLAEKGTKISSLTAVSARGGLLKPLKSGTYKVNEAMLTDLREGKRGMHASHLSAQIGDDIAREAGVNCYVVDPISVDELDDIARFTGHPLFEREVLSHALNMKAVAKRHCFEQKLSYPQQNLIVVHLGTGISLSVHHQGRMIDIMNPSEEGAFSLDRSGGMPCLQVVKYVLENHLEYKTFRKMMFGSGGLSAYLGTTDFLKVLEEVKKNNPRFIAVVEAMAYQIAKEIGALATAVSGRVDAILFTGGMARSDYLIDLIDRRVRYISEIFVYPGEDEMEALAFGVLRVIGGEEQAMEY